MNSNMAADYIKNDSNYIWKVVKKNDSVKDYTLIISKEKGNLEK